jgi:protein-tyrosine phosphatase
MVDIHSHIVPGVDDGSTSVEESLRMLRRAAIDGITDIVATPHASPKYTFDPEVNRARLADVIAAGQIIRIHTGCDFHLQLSNVEDALQRPSRYAINGRNYLLVELSDLTIFNNTEDMYAALARAGLRCVLTHPERNQLLRQRLPRLRSWVESGVLMQVTAAAITGHFGARARKFSFDMLDRNMVHVVASDAHDSHHRPPVMSRAYRVVAERYGDQRAQALFVTHPRAMLTGAPVAPGEMVEPPPRRWYNFWRRGAPAARVPLQ